jgi:hypothetical protein
MIGPLPAATLRRWVRHLAVLLAGVIAGGRAIGAAQACAEARRWSARDPSEAEALRSFCQVDAAVALLSLAIAALVWWLLRPANRS